jgi:hypothetical protein
MKPIYYAVILCGIMTWAVVTNGQEKAERTAACGTVMEEGNWWNLYFDEENNPLQRGKGSIHAVKVLQRDERRPSWIKIAFPKERDEHYSIFGPAAKAHDDDDLAIEEALADWEETVDEWKVMWVNLDYVVYATEVGKGVSAKPE